MRGARKHRMQHWMRLCCNKHVALGCTRLRAQYHVPSVSGNLRTALLLLLRNVSRSSAPGEAAWTRRPAQSWRQLAAGRRTTRTLRRSWVRRYCPSDLSGEDARLLRCSAGDACLCVGGRQTQPGPAPAHVSVSIGDGSASASGRGHKRTVRHSTKLPNWSARHQHRSRGGDCCATSRPSGPTASGAT